MLCNDRTKQRRKKIKKNEPSSEADKRDAQEERRVEEEKRISGAKS